MNRFPFIGIHLWILDLPTILNRFYLPARLLML